MSAGAQPLPWQELGIPVQSLGRCPVRHGEPCLELPGKLKFPLPSLASTALTVATECDDTSKEKGDLLKGSECGSLKGIVGKEVGEGRDYVVSLGGVVGAGKDHVEFVTEGVGGAVRAVAKLVGDVPVGGWGEEWWVGRALPWHRSRRRGMEASEGRRWR